MLHRETSLFYHEFQSTVNCVLAGTAFSLQRDSVVARSEIERIQRLQDDVFNKGCIPWWIAVAGYVVFATLAIIVIPFLYIPVKW